MQLNRLVSVMLTLLLAFFVRVASADSSLNGVAVQTELGKDLFVAGLFTTKLTDDPRQLLLSSEKKRMEVRVLPNRLSSRRFKRMWIELLAINASPSELTTHAQDMADFSNFLKFKLIAGDIFAIHRTVDSVEVYLNGARIGMITNPKFFDLLLRTWIGPVPPSTRFKEGILSGGDIDAQLLSRFNATSPSSDRIAAIENAVAQLKANAEATPTEKTIASIPKPKINTDIKIPVPVIEKPVIDTKVSQVKPKPAPKPKPLPAKLPPKPVAVPKPATPSLVTEEPTTASLSDLEADLPVADVEPLNTPELKLDVDTKALLDDESGSEEDVPFTAESLLNQTLYIGKLRRWSYQNLKYPARAASRGQEGSVRVLVVIDRSGRVKKIEILEKSEYNSLNKEAEQAVKRADPFPPPPEGVGGSTFEFTLPVTFKLQASRRRG